MRNFPWLVRRNKNGEETSPVLAGGCRQAQDFLAAAFDGEANDETLAQTRRHIVDCPHCAHQWSQWENNRVLLRSMPVPAVPPSLLTRILLACRLMPVQDNTSDASVESSNRVRLAQYLDAVEDESMVAPLGPLMTPVPLPTDLHRRILQATTETAPGRSFSLIALLRQWVPWAPASRNAMRWGMGLAVPAMLCWFVLAQNPALLVEKPVSPETAPLKTKTQSATTAVASAIKPLVKKSVKMARELPHLAAMAAESSSVVSGVPQPVEKNINERGLFLPERTREESRIVASSPVSFTERRVRAGSVKKRIAPEIDFVENHTPSVRLASSQQPIARLPLRSTPKISHPPLATTPRLALLSESDFEDAFVAVTTARDNRPTEFGQAFDEYRAALLTQHSDGDDDMEEL